MAVSTVAQEQRFYSEQWARFERPKDKLEPKARVSYFNNDKVALDLCAYDIRFHPELGYDQYTHRCDTVNLRKLRENIFKEERKKSLSVLTSFDFGRFTVPLEFPGMYARKPNAIREFYQICRFSLKEDRETPSLCLQ